MCRDVRLTREVETEIRRANVRRRAARAERDREIAREAYRRGRVRTVDRDGLVRFNGRTYCAPLAWRGKTLFVIEEVVGGAVVRLANGTDHVHLRELGRPARGPKFGDAALSTRVGFWICAALALATALLIFGSALR